MESHSAVKVGAAVLLVVLILVLGAQILSFLSQTSKTQKDFTELQGKLEQAKADQNKFTADLDYYLNPQNLKKELKGRFNYKEPGEKMLILVNKESSSSTKSLTPR